MPLYEFRCPECNEKGEVVQPFKADPPLCSQCNQKTKRLMSSPAMVKIDNIPIKYKSLGVANLKDHELGR